jgi:hypothetical protein
MTPDLDPDHVLAKRGWLRFGDEHNGASMRLTQHERKGHDEELVAEVIADVQDPAAPTLCAVCHGQRTHNASCVVTRFREIADSGAVPIEQNAL